METKQTVFMKLHSRQDANNMTRCLLFVLMMMPSMASAQAVSIDDIATDQGPVTNNHPGYSGMVIATGVIGGVRELRASRGATVQVSGDTITCTLAAFGDFCYIQYDSVNDDNFSASPLVPAFADLTSNDRIAFPLITTGPILLWPCFEGLGGSFGCDQIPVAASDTVESLFTDSDYSGVSRGRESRI